MVKKSASRISDGHAWRYNHKYNAIKKYVDFNHDSRHNLQQSLSSAEKYRINRYFKEIAELTIRPHIVTRFRNHEKSDLIHDKANVTTKNRSHLTAQFLPIHAPRGAKVKVISEIVDGVRRKDIEITRDDGITIRLITFNPDMLELENLEGYVNELVKNYGNNIRFEIQCGNALLGEQYSKKNIGKAVASLSGGYLDDDSNHFYKKWLYGLAVYSYPKQITFGKYIVDRGLTKSEQIQQRKKFNRLLKKRPSVINKKRGKKKTKKVVRKKRGKK